jgi:DNA-3-methyladenine glycosylase II
MPLLDIDTAAGIADIAAPPIARIETAADIAAALDALCAADPRLGAVRAAVPLVPLRRRPPGLDGLLRIVVGQQLSTRAATAIWTRLEARLGAMTPVAILALGDEEFRALGLSRGKIVTFRGIAKAVAGGRLDLERVASGSADAALEALRPLPGVGPWTANIYMMFCAGHPDIFPVGDLALQRAVAAAFDLFERRGPDALAAIAAPWAPHRATAARLFWA